MPRSIGTIEQEEETFGPIGGVKTTRSIGRSENVRAAILEEVTGDTVIADDFLLPKGMRIDITRSDTLINKRKKFREAFPEGELREVSLPFPLQGHRTLVFRTNRDEPLREVFPGGDPSLGTSIIAEPEKTLLPVAGQMAAGLPGLVAGSLISPFVEKGVERVRGFKEGTVGGMAVEGSIDTALNVGADILTRGATRLVRGGLSKSAGGSFSEGLVEPLPGSQRVISAAEQEGLHPLATGQIARTPVTQSIFQQVTALTSRGAEFLNAQQRKLFEVVKQKSVKTGADGLRNEELAVLVDGERKTLNEVIKKLPQGSDTKGGEALKEGAEIFKKDSSVMGGRLYGEAFDIAKESNVKFDISETISLGNKLASGIKAQGKTITKDVDIGLLDQSGKPITRSETSQELINVREALSKDISDVVRDLNELDPVLRNIDTPIGRSTAAEQIQALRTRLFDIKQRAEGEVMGKLANDMWHSFTTAMHNPIGGSKTFVTAWKKANGFWRFRETELEKGAVATILKGNNPEALFRAFGKRGNFTALQRAKDLIPPRQWNTFRESFVADLVNDPKRLVSKLNTLNTDKQSKRLLLDVAEENMLRKWAIGTERLEKSVLNKISTENKANISKAYEITKNTTSKDIEEQISRSGGKNSEFAVSLRAGLYEHVLGKSEALDTVGNSILDPKKFEAAVSDVLSLEAARVILGREGMRTFRNFELYANTIKQSSDVGTSLIRSSVSSQMSSPTKPGKAFAAARKIIDKRLWGLILTQPASHAGILRANKLPIGLPWLKMVTTAVTTSINAHQNISKGKLEGIKDTSKRLIKNIDKEK